MRHLGVDGSLSLGFNATKGSLAIALKGSPPGLGEQPRVLNGLTKCREGDRVGIGLKFHKVRCRGNLTAKDNFIHWIPIYIWRQEIVHIGRIDKSSKT